MSRGLVVEDLKKTFGQGGDVVRAVDGVALRVEEGEFFTLLGASGCGKTTLLRLIAGFERADAGSVLLGGLELLTLPAHRRPVNTVFQNYALFPHMTVFENVAFGLRMRDIDKTEISRAVSEALDMVRLSGLSARKPGHLSGGEQQRVALARALINRPQLLLLDEPLSSLDYQLRKEMQTELKRLQDETGITFVAVTHDQDEALSMSDRVAVMDRGKILQTGVPSAIYHHPVSRFVASFVGTCNFVRPDILGLPSGPDVGFRPEDVTFITHMFQARIAVSGSVMQIRYRGPVTHYLIRLDSGDVVTASSAAPEPVKVDERVRLSINPERLIRCAA